MEGATGKTRNELRSRQVTLGSRPEYAELGEWIRKIRESKGLQQRPLSRALGKPEQYLTKVEAGRQRVDAVELFDLLSEMEYCQDKSFSEFLESLPKQ